MFQLRFSCLHKLVTIGIVAAFGAQSILPSITLADAITLPGPGETVNLSTPFTPALLRGVTLHPDNPFQFDFILDEGNEKLVSADLQANQNAEASLRSESKRLVNYFLASLTIPEKNLWVNLSPNEPDRIIPDALSKTELGQDLLTQDYILKQLTASLMQPDGETGRELWDRIYERAQKELGITDVPLDTFSKIWILPESATIYEHENTVYITSAKLKIMTDEDYSLSKNSEFREKGQNSSLQKLIKQIVIPEIEEEVNTGKNFARLRQIFYSLILAKWYKDVVRNSILEQLYVGKNKVSGIDLNENKAGALSDNHYSQSSIEKIYTQYMQALKQGVYEKIKEEYDPLTQQIIPKKYFSGGFKDQAMIIKHAAQSDVGHAQTGKQIELKVKISESKKIQLLKNFQKIRQFFETTQEENKPTAVSNGNIFFPGETLKFDDQKDGILFIADHETGKSSLSIKLLEYFKNLTCVSPGASRGRWIHKNGSYQDLIVERHSNSDIIYSRNFGKKKIRLSPENLVKIRWIISLDDTDEAFLETARQQGIEIIDISDLNIFSDFEEIVRKIKTIIIEHQSQNDSTPPIALEDPHKESQPQFNSAFSIIPTINNQKDEASLSSAVTMLIATPFIASAITAVLAIGFSLHDKKRLSTIAGLKTELYSTKDEFGRLDALFALTQSADPEAIRIIQLANKHLKLANTDPILWDLFILFTNIDLKIADVLLTENNLTMLRNNYKLPRQDDEFEFPWNTEQLEKFLMSLTPENVNAKMKLFPEQWERPIGNFAKLNENDSAMINTVILDDLIVKHTEWSQALMVLKNKLGEIIPRKQRHVQTVTRNLFYLMNKNLEAIYELLPPKLKSEIYKEEYLKELQNLSIIFEGLSSQYKNRLILAVIFHDIGAGPLDRDWLHDQIGSERVKTILKDLQYDEFLAEHVSKLIINHGLLTNVGVNFFPDEFSSLSYEEKDMVLLMSFLDISGGKGEYNELSLPDLKNLQHLYNILIEDFTHNANPEEFVAYRLGKFLSPFLLPQEQIYENYAKIEAALNKRGVDIPNFIENWGYSIRVNVFGIFLSLANSDFEAFVDLLVMISDEVNALKETNPEFNDVSIESNVDFMALPLRGPGSEIRERLLLNVKELIHSQKLKFILEKNVFAQDILTLQIDSAMNSSILINHQNIDPLIANGEIVELRYMQEKKEGQDGLNPKFLDRVKIKHISFFPGDPTTFILTFINSQENEINIILTTEAETFTAEGTSAQIFKISESVEDKLDVSSNPTTPIVIPFDHTRIDPIIKTADTVELSFLPEGQNSRLTIRGTVKAFAKYPADSRFNITILPENEMEEDAVTFILTPETANGLVIEGSEARLSTVVTFQESKQMSEFPEDAAMLGTQSLLLGSTYKQETQLQAIVDRGNKTQLNEPDRAQVGGIDMSLTGFIREDGSSPKIQFNLNTVMLKEMQSDEFKGFEAVITNMTLLSSVLPLLEISAR